MASDGLQVRIERSTLRTLDSIKLAMDPVSVMDSSLSDNDRAKLLLYCRACCKLFLVLFMVRMFENSTLDPTIEVKVRGNGPFSDLFKLTTTSCLSCKGDGRLHKDAINRLAMLQPLNEFVRLNTNSSVNVALCLEGDRMVNFAFAELRNTLGSDASYKKVHIQSEDGRLRLGADEDW